MAEIKLPEQFRLLIEIASFHSLPAGPHERCKYITEYVQKEYPGNYVIAFEYTNYNHLKFFPKFDTEADKTVFLLKHT